jgi:hypothetical protein
MEKNDATYNINYVKNPTQRYTMNEIRAMIEQARRDSAAGLGIDSEDMFRELRREFEQEEMELELSEAV